MVLRRGGPWSAVQFEIWWKNKGKRSEKWSERRVVFGQRSFTCKHTMGYFSPQNWSAFIHLQTCKLEMFHPKGDIKRGVFLMNTLFYMKIRKGHVSLKKGGLRSCGFLGSSFSWNIQRGFTHKSHLRTGLSHVGGAVLTRVSDLLVNGQLLETTTKTLETGLCFALYT